MVGLAIAVIFSCNTFAFLAAVRYTTVANTLIILSGTPFFAAVLSLIILKEPVARRTWVAIAATLFGIGVIVWDGLGSGGYFGDLMALLAAVLLAFKLTIVRQQRRINMIPALALSGLIFALMAIVIAGEPARPDTAQIIWLLLMGLAVITPATALLTLGPRYLSAPEVSLLMLLETVLGPVWVWLVIEETPTPLALTGGAIVVSTLMIHALAGLRKGRQSQSGDRGLVEGPVPAE